MSQEQNFKNHVRLDPVFHGFLTIGALILLVSTIYALVRQEPDWWGAVRLLGVLWALALMFTTRTYALKVQDRLIRLEERLRLTQLLPESARARIDELNEGQLIALRFASDGEVTGLVQQTLDGKWDRKQIKSATSKTGGRITSGFEKFLGTSGALLSYSLGMKGRWLWIAGVAVLTLTGCDRLGGRVLPVPAATRDAGH